AGLHIKKDGVAQTLAVDNIIICAGQEPNRTLHQQLTDMGLKTHLIGGADVASELDAKRAIAQGAELAAII
ncbi:MAG: NADPH-dependent 2,4-dienoyl-CoA reductase, partial [Arenimonas sp.]|nr:NADPH-dependent 2,4-dienoyl-CoA reductase [Arenimonas sp.]